MINSLCGDGIFDYNETTGRVQLIGRTFLKKADFYPSLAGDGRSHQRVTTHIKKRLLKLSRQLSTDAVAELNSYDIIECPTICEGDRTIITELQSLYDLRHRIIAGELPYSKAALDQALANSIGL